MHTSLLGLTPSGLISCGRKVWQGAGEVRSQKVERARRCPTSSTGQAAACQSRSGSRQLRPQMEQQAPPLCENSTPLIDITYLTYQLYMAAIASTEAFTDHLLPYV